jgi:hypothetical protein
MPTEPAKAEPPKLKRRWFQFSLRTLLIVVTLLAAICPVVVWVVRDRDRLIQERDDAMRRAAQAEAELKAKPMSGYGGYGTRGPSSPFVIPNFDPSKRTPIHPLAQVLKTPPLKTFAD